MWGPRSAFSVANVIVCDDLILIRHLATRILPLSTLPFRIKFENVADVICDFSAAQGGAQAASKVCKKPKVQIPGNSCLDIQLSVYLMSRNFWTHKDLAKFAASHTELKLFLGSMFLCGFLEIYIPFFFSPLPSGMQISKQNTHRTFDPINNSTPVHFRPGLALPVSYNIW